MIQLKSTSHRNLKWNFKKILCLFFTLAFILNQTLLSVSVAQAASVSETNSEVELSVEDQAKLVQEQTEIEQVAQAIEQNVEAPRTQKDVFHITHQTLTENEKQFALSETNLALPESQVINFAKDVKIFSTEAGLQFEMKFKGNNLRHTIPNFKPLSWTIDKEMLVFVNQDAQVFAVDLGLAKNLLFKGPLPVFRIGAIPKDLLNQPFEMTFVTRKTDLPDSDHPSAMIPMDRRGDLYQAGDLLVYSQSSSSDSARTRLALLDRDIITTQLSRDEALLASLAFQSSLRDEHEAMLKPLLALQREANPNPEVENPSDLVQQAFTALGNQAALELLAQSHLNDSSKGAPLRDTFTASEANTSAEIAAVNFAKNSQSPTIDKKSLFRRSQQLIEPLLKPKALAVLASSLVGAYFIHDTPEAERALRWSSYIFNEMYDKVLPNVLKDSAYRITLLKSSIALTAFVPLMLGIGHAFNYYLRVSDTAQKGVAALSFRIYGAVSLPFWHRIIVSIRQETFMKALREGVNPLMKIMPESYLGQAAGLTKAQRVGVVPYGSNRENVSDTNGKILSQISNNKYQIKALSWQLALIAASEKTQLDPASLALAIQENNMSSVFERLSSDPELQAKWSELAKEFHFTLLKMKKGLITQDLSQISKADLYEIYEMAVKISDQIDKRSKLASMGKKLYLQFQSLLAASSRNASQFGITEYEFLKNAKPNDFVANQMWKQFSTDFLLAIYQIGLVGDRADLAKPHDLAAAEHELLWTTPGHRFDMIDQFMIYGINLPAQLGLVYQKQARLREDSYTPIEDTSLQGATKQDGFFKGLYVWTKGAVNINQAKYGDVFLRDLVKRIKTIQAGFLMTVVGRMVCGNQPFVDAALAFTFTTIWKTWQYSWIWQPIRAGSQSLETEYGQRAKKFKNAKTLLGRGLRLDDSQSIFDGYQALADLYSQNDDELPIEIQQLIKNASNVIDPHSDLWTQNGEAAALDRTLINKLQQAILSGDSQALESVRTEIINHYGVDLKSSPHGLTVDSIELLTYAIEHPPYATKYHEGVEWFTTLSGALITTYMATSMMVGTFQSNISWGEKIGEASLMSAGLYTAVYTGQKIIEKIVVRYDQWKSRTVKPSMCLQLY